MDVVITSRLKEFIEEMIDYIKKGENEKALESLEKIKRFIDGVLSVTADRSIVNLIAIIDLHIPVYEELIEIKTRDIPEIFRKIKSMEEVLREKSGRLKD